MTCSLSFRPGISPFFALRANIYFFRIKTHRKISNSNLGSDAVHKPPTSIIAPPPHALIINCGGHWWINYFVIRNRIIIQSTITPLTIKSCLAARLQGRIAFSLFILLFGAATKAKLEANTNSETKYIIAALCVKWQGFQKNIFAVKIRNVDDRVRRAERRVRGLPRPPHTPVQGLRWGRPQAKNQNWLISAGRDLSCSRH